MTSSAISSSVSNESWQFNLDVIEKKFYDKLVGRTNDDKLHTSWKRFDRSGKGYITPKDLVEEYAQAGLLLEPDLATYLFQRYDFNNDGKITFDDFTKYMNDTRLVEQSNIRRLKLISQSDDNTIESGNKKKEKAAAWVASCGVKPLNDHVSSWISMKSTNERSSEELKSMSEKPYHIPGYRGFIRGQANNAAETFGNMTRRTLNEDDQLEIYKSSPNKISQHIPGYTGFTPRSTREETLAK